MQAAARVPTPAFAPGQPRVAQRGPSLTRSVPRAAVVARAASGKDACISEGDLVLVAGATGGVGQLVTAKLLDKGFKVRALVRDQAKAEALFGSHPELEIMEADLRQSEDAVRATEGVDAVACITGTTAFPSTRWEGNNGPRPTDFDAMKNLIEATPSSVKRFLYNTSVGVDRFDSFPFLILNLFGVLRYKKLSEDRLIASGLPWTICRPGRLTDGPYTSYDLNTLLQATSGSRQDVTLSPIDDLQGEASRIAVAEAIAQAMVLECMVGKKFAISSIEGDGPGQDNEKWEALFQDQVLNTPAKETVMA